MIPPPHFTFVYRYHVPGLQFTGMGLLRFYGLGSTYRLPCVLQMPARSLDTWVPDSAVQSPPPLPTSLHLRYAVFTVTTTVFTLHDTYDLLTTLPPHLRFTVTPLISRHHVCYVTQLPFTGTIFTDTLRYYTAAPFYGTVHTTPIPPHHTFTVPRYRRFGMDSTLHAFLYVTTTRYTPAITPHDAGYI